MDRLVERVDKLREEISMFEAQLSAQLEETKAAKVRVVIFLFSRIVRTVFEDYGALGGW